MRVIRVVGVTIGLLIAGILAGAFAGAAAGSVVLLSIGGDADDLLADGLRLSLITGREYRRRSLASGRAGGVSWRELTADVRAESARARHHTGCRELPSWPGPGRLEPR